MAAAFYVYVKDADVAYRAALDAGGEPLEGLTNQFWGDRVGTIKDFAGNKWMIATHVEDVDADELTRRARLAMAA
jgi:PhnB protein